MAGLDAGLRRAGTICLGLLLTAGSAWWMAGPDWRALLANPPAGRDVLFWNDSQRSAAFRMMDRLPFLIGSRRIARGDGPAPLPVGPALALADGTGLAEYMNAQNSAALVVLHKGQIRLEEYAQGFTATGRWTSFSVAKSITSTLVGAAIQDGYIAGTDEPVTTYLPQLKGSAYEGVTIAQLLTMTSGVAWNEDYEDPGSDVARFDRESPPAGQNATLSYMSRLQRAHPAGDVWNYSTGETNLIGLLVSAATGQDLATYLSETIWAPYGMQADASWLLGQDGHEISGCCIQATTRDFARFGQFVLEGGRIRGQQVVPPGWFASATRKQTGIGQDGYGYGFQWWTFDDGSFMADGIFGQGIFIDPSRQLVIASNANWTSATGEVGGEWAARERFHRAVQEALDAEEPR